MYIVDGIAYAGEMKPVIKVCGVKAMENNKLWVRFNTGEAKVFDFTPLLSTAAFSPLADREVFNGVYIDYGVPVWNGGDIDIAPEALYENGELVDGAESA